MDKPMSSHRILALIGGTELLGKERGNLEALSALKKTRSNSDGGGVQSSPQRRSSRSRSAAEGIRNAQFPMGSHFSKRWMLLDGAYRKNQLKRLWSNSKELTSTIREWNPSHVSQHMTPSFLPRPFSSTGFPWCFAGDAPPVASRFQMFIWKWMVRRSQRMVSVSHFIKNRVTRVVRSAKKTVVIHNIAPSRKGNPDQDLIQTLTTEKRPFQLVYVGQLHAIKGVPLLVDALLALGVGGWLLDGRSNVHTRKEKKLKEKVANSPSRTSIRWEGFVSDPPTTFRSRRLAHRPFCL